MNTDANLSKCNTLLCVIDAGSFTAAARRLDYAQSTVSRMVADLEAEWGVRLLERSRAGVKPTADCEKLLPSIRLFCSQGCDLATRIDDLHGEVAGMLRIGTISSVATHWLPKATAAFSSLYPDVTYELLLGNYTEIESWIKSGRVDCGFVRLPCTDGLETMALAEDELFTVFPKDHPLVEKKSITAKDLCKYPFLSLSENDDVEDAGIFAKAGVEPDIRVTTWDDYSVMAMVEAGLGISVLPGLILKRIPYEVELRPLRPKAHRTLAYAMRGSGYAPLIAQKFSKTLQELKSLFTRN